MYSWKEAAIPHVTMVLILIYAIYILDHFLQATRDVDDPVDMEQARKDAQVLQFIF